MRTSAADVIVPAVLWGVSKFLSINLSLLDCLCIYGYALFVFIPVTVYIDVSECARRFLSLRLFIFLGVYACMYGWMSVRLLVDSL